MALDQISSETLKANQQYLTTGNYGTNRISRSGIQMGRLETVILDERLYNIAEPSSIASSFFALAFSQLHSLKEEQFKTFSSVFIERLERTQKELEKLNQIKSDIRTKQRIAEFKEMAIADGLTAERIALLEEKIRIDEAKNYKAEHSLNLTYGSALLLNSVFNDQQMTNRNVIDAQEVMTQQRLRALSILNKALEKNVFDSHQKSEIKGYLEVALAAKRLASSEASFKKYYEATYLDSRVQHEMRTLVEGLNKPQSIMCRSL